MVLQVTFIVDKIEDDECLGFTNDMTKINHNLQLLPDEFLPKFWHALKQSQNGLTLIITVGRYLCMIAIAKDKSAGSMTFFDTLQKDELANKICETLNSTQLKESFMEQHLLLKPHYKKHFNDVVLSKETFFFN
jgi:hypothetical protein